MSAQKTGTKTRKRNPAFPLGSLPKALEKAQVIYSAEGRKPMAPGTATKHWGYSIASSSAHQAISALKQYGLIEDKKIEGHRKLQLTETALKILLDKREESVERLNAIRKSAISPKIFAELWKKRGDDDSFPSDAELSHYLLLERKQPYYDDVVPNLIKDFKATMAFAKMGENATIDDEVENIADEMRIDTDEDVNAEQLVKVGDYVQWTSQGVARFEMPRKVMGLSDDGQWAFVENEPTGVAVSQLTTHEKPRNEAKLTNTPPPNPNYKAPPMGDLIPISVLMGKGASQIISIPKMSGKAFEFFKKQLEAFKEAIVVDTEEATNG